MRQENKTALIAQAVARESYGRLLAILSARSGDVAKSEDALSYAFEAALNKWEKNGIPENPEAWLLTVARHHLIDGVRSQQVQALMLHEMGLLKEEAWESNVQAIPDKRLALMFACAHPAIDQSMHAPLILQTMLGLEASTIACAFLISPKNMAQKLVRAKRKIRDAGIRFELPDKDEMAGRLIPVLNAIYSAYSNAWLDASGLEAVSRDLAKEAIWLAQLLVDLLPNEPEALGLLALIIYLEARLQSRQNQEGEYIPLSDQDCKQWDHVMINLAEKLLLKASTLKQVGRFQLEAAIQSAYAMRRHQTKVDWQAIVQLYEHLFSMTNSPVVKINYALAVAELGEVNMACYYLEELAENEQMKEYQPYWAALAHISVEIGNIDKARHAFIRAIGLSTHIPVRKFLQRKLDYLHNGDFVY